jgi:hypothetical protein
MACIITGSINLSNIPKDKIIEGKKGKYLPISISINEELDPYGNQGPITVSQSKEEREAKSAKTYLGNIKVVWGNGVMPDPAPRDNQQQAPQAKASMPMVESSDLPF